MRSSEVFRGTQMTPLPCPFCGQRAEPSVHTEYGGEMTWRDGMGSPGPIYHTTYLVVCAGEGSRPHRTGCGATVNGADEADAVARWNRRVPLKVPT